MVFSLYASLYCDSGWVCIGNKTDKNNVPFISHSVLFVYRMSFSLRVYTCIRMNVGVCMWIFTDCVLCVRSCTLLPVFAQILCLDDVVYAAAFYSMANVWLTGYVCACVNVFVLHYSICVTLFCAFFGSNSVYRSYSIYYGRQREEKRNKERNSKEKAPTQKQTQKHTHTIIFSAPDFHNHWILK